MTAGGRTLPVLGAAVALAVLALMIAESMRRAGWVFEYPLDDVYIHLAMAGGIAHGTYGINPGEAASASSSILYPFLLLPFPGTSLQRFLPLAWNALAVTALGALWGRAIALATLPVGLTAILLLGGPPLLYISGVGYVGMEHALHAVAALACVFGLNLWLRERRLAGWFVAALILAPMFRLEGLALSLLCCAVVALTGRPRASLLLAAATVAPVGLFSLFLVSRGLDPLPSSVLVKLATVGPTGVEMHGPFATLRTNLRQIDGQNVLVLSLLALARAALPSRRHPCRPMLAAAGLAGLAHLAFARFGSAGRYEAYLFVTLSAALLIGWRDPARSPAAAIGAAAGVTLSLAIGVFGVFVPTSALYLENPRAVIGQQVQMARLSHRFLPVPVAVNDIGRVAWNAPAYVLDLWGLAYAPARQARLHGATPGWAGPLARGRGVEYAMIYDNWLGQAVPDDWRPVARLVGLGPRAEIGDRTVTIYAVGPDRVARVSEAVKAWSRDLPAGTRLDWIAPAAS